MILAPVLLAILPAADAGGFLFREGSHWMYSAKVEYTLPNSNRTRSATINWEMAVVMARNEDSLSASVVLGWVDQLPWFEPGLQPAESLAVREDGRVFVVSPQGESARELYGRGPPAWREAIKNLEPVLVFPLHVGAHWGSDAAGRVDGLYRWNVESASRQSVRGVGPATVFRLRYQTMPDHQILDLAPETGVVGYVYDHHGTVSHVDLRLLSFQGPSQ